MDLTLLSALYPDRCRQVKIQHGVGTKQQHTRNVAMSLTSNPKISFICSKDADMKTKFEEH